MFFRFLCGDSTPLFALIGVCLASGTGILTKDDELEGVCWEIRVSIKSVKATLVMINIYLFEIPHQEAVSRLHNKPTNDNDSCQLVIGLDNLEIGPPIAKGCSAVVYAATLKESSHHTKSNNSATLDKTYIEQFDQNPVSSIKPSSRFVHRLGPSLDNLYFTTNQSSKFNHSREQHTKQRRVRFASEMEVNYSWQSDDNSSSDNAHKSWENIPTGNFNENIDRYPLALKMMFNYDIQSNAMAILRAMYKETLPAIHKFKNPDADSWEQSLREQTITLPSHPNIVTMVGVFCAPVPDLMQSTSLYPMALPPRLNPNGYGRNMSLFLLMKRYSHSLCEYLVQVTETDSTMRTRILLFTQLLEGVTHLYRHGVAHRDLKSDNILIDINHNDRYPILTLSDFGCCVADKHNGLCIPYPSMDIDKGGNTALMAPEIITKKPGTFSILDYSKSDLWACGAIAYEIFGEQNPFYYNENSKSTMNISDAKVLKSVSYKDDDLPPLRTLIPLIVRKLVANILQRNPNKRLSPDVAANVLQLFLWAPSTWLKPTMNVSSPEILQWLLSLTTKVLYEAKLNNMERLDAFESSCNTKSNRTHTEYFLLTSFLIRAQLQHIRSALEWIRQIVENN